MHGCRNEEGSVLSRLRITYAFLPILTFCLAHSLRGASDRITAPIDDSQRTVLTGHVSPQARYAIDQGLMDSSFELPYVMLVLKPSAAQQSDLDHLLEAQLNPASPEYHHWLTPEQYADRFGVSQADADKITGWLSQQGFTVKSVARGRNAIAFSGAAGQIGSAFGTEIHRYLANGELHYANRTDPSIPAAFDEVVSAIHGLHDFHMRPRYQRYAQPRDTEEGQHYLAPGDIATIYDITPLYNAGINGSGQTLVVVGDVQIGLNDIDDFRSMFGLPAGNPEIILVPNNTNPGTCNPNNPTCDLPEADLDLELSGAVAPDAKLLYVFAPDVTDAVQYAIDNALAPVISDSYGLCELQTGLADADIYQQWALQANAQGITWFAASGDDGAADCFGGNDPATNNSISVDTPASIPQVTGIGGTEFNEGSGTYWSSLNRAGYASALSYIPEVAWNDSLLSQDDDQGPAASGGGASVFFTKPSWQTGEGVPNDGARDVPDVSISAAPKLDPYEIFTGGSLVLIGGTSVGPPQFAGLAVLLNQYLVSHGYQSSPGLGNINPTLYTLGDGSGVFHDITQGNNIVTPCNSQMNCRASPIGYDAGPGYDLVTGLGTVDFNKLVTAWHGGSVTTKSPVTLTVTASAASLTFSGSAILTAQVASSNGGTPTGTVSFSIGKFSLGTATLAPSNGGAAASLTIQGFQLAAGTNSITAVYSGDASFDGSTASINVTITSTAAGTPSPTGLVNGASFTASMAPGGVLSVFGTNLAPAAGIAPSLPLPTMMAGTWVSINGVIAPLYYVSPTQLNLQIPYETPTNRPVSVTVNNLTTGASGSASITVQTTAPAIFTFDNGAPVPYTTAARGQEIALYITGAGALSPPVADGTAPSAGTALADLPAPVASVALTVGKVAANLDFVGVPTWSAGVVQINYTIPATAPLGLQPVVVSVGGVESAVTQLTVTE